MMFKYLFCIVSAFLTVGFSLLVQRLTKRKSGFFSSVVSIFTFLLLGFLFFEAGVRLFGAQSVIVRQVESGEKASFMHDPQFLIRKTNKGLRLMRNARVTILNHQLSGLDIDINTNSHGFRDEELGEKNEGEKRILFLGDSITLGDYLPAEEVFVEVAEEVLKEKFGDNLEAVNAGLSDIGIKEEVDILKEEGLKTEPNLVILDFYLNDSRPPWGFEDEPGKRFFLRRYSLATEWVFNKFKLWRWLETDKSRFDWILYVKDRPGKLKPEEFEEVVRLAKYDWGAAWEEDSWRVIREGLIRLKKKAEENGFKVGVVIFPVSFQIYADEPDDFPQKKMREIADSMGIPFFDLLPVLRDNYEPEGAQIYYDQCHPTKLGNEIIGRAITDFVIKENLLLD